MLTDPKTLQLIAHIRRIILDGDELTDELEGQIAALVATILTTRGDLIYRNATTAARLAVGTSGRVLRSDGTDPTWTTGLFSGLIEFPQNGDYKLIVNLPFPYTPTSVTTISGSGTCTATVKINTTALGGAANSVSTSEVTQAHSTNNVAAAGDDVVLTISNNASCQKLSITIA